MYLVVVRIVGFRWRFLMYLIYEEKFFGSFRRVVVIKGIVSEKKEVY